MESYRVEKILKLCKNKKVLDLGCVDHSAKTETYENWLHKKIKEVSKELIGLDYEKKELEKLNKKGYNIIYGDAENFDLKKKFDVVVAGEIIEHLFNVGNFLDCIKKHMNKNSILIITTPNAFGFRRMIGSILKGSLKENIEHTAYYSDTTLRQVLQRKGFKNIKFEYLKSDDKKVWRRFIENIISSLLRKETRMNLLVTCKIK
jgi:2-polyprenyl-3-methyl-5-hydroxy-6-metoxy-1,4-benzoquinol methylase